MICALKHTKEAHESAPDKDSAAQKRNWYVLIELTIVIYP